MEGGFLVFSGFQSGPKMSFSETSMFIHTGCFLMGIGIFQLEKKSPEAPVTAHQLDNPITLCWLLCSVIICSQQAFWSGVTGVCYH